MAQKRKRRKKCSEHNLCLNWRKEHVRQKSFLLAKPFITGAAAAATTTQDNTARTLLYSTHRQTAVQTERLSQCLFRHRSSSTLASLVFEFGYHFVYHQRPSKTFRQEEKEEEEHDEEEEEEKAKKQQQKFVSQCFCRCCCCCCCPLCLPA